MRVLLSIKSEFASKIFDGSKKYEYRRTIFKKAGVDKVLVYASGGPCGIIGEFEIGHILHNDLQTLWSNTKTEAGITEEAFFNYFANKDHGYAISIKSATLYDPPLPLEAIQVHSAPQSFQYV